MSQYRRNRIAGGTYFFTVNLQDRRSDALVARIDVLRAAVREVRSVMPFHADAWVVLPEHLHCLWTLPAGDVDFSTRWKRIKARFSQSIPVAEHRTASQRRRGERGIWQRRFWEHTIRDDADFAAHFDYIHFNPVRHGLVANAFDWPFSSLRRCIAEGLYPKDWRLRTEMKIYAGEPGGA